MPAGWPLTMALASLEDEIWSATPFAAVGTMSPEDDGLVRFELRTRVATSVNRLAPDEFLTGGAIDRMLSPWHVGPLARAAIEGAAATCVAALPDAREFQDAETATLAQLARRLAALSREPEPAAGSAGRRAASRRTRAGASWTITGRATCASCATSSSARRSSARAG